jgi:succinyldiaminopimelate aminotransferase apoenzyme (EC 2.6.1.17)
MRSGFVAGDAAIIAKFLLYRTYHGSAMSPSVQMASVAAWNDEAHVVENRRLYAEKFAAVQPMLNSVMPAAMPDAAFYLWVRVPGDDAAFARKLTRTTTSPYCLAPSSPAISRAAILAQASSVSHWLPRSPNVLTPQPASSN